MTSARPYIGNVHANSAPLDSFDELCIANVEESAAKGAAVHRWWRDVDACNSYDQQFNFVRDFNCNEQGFGFFDRVPMGHEPLEVMGSVTNEFFDRPRATLDLDQWCAELREFTLQYFMRVSDYRRPTASVEGSRHQTGALRGLSWCPQPVNSQSGFGYSQIYYKRMDGQVGKFPEGQRFNIVDARQIGTTYEWVVLRVQIFDFEIDVTPFGESLPRFAVPLKEETLVVLTKDYIVDQTHPTSDLRAQYGFGYSLLRQPTDDSLIAYGPGHFTVGFQSYRFDVEGDGTTKVSRVFVVNRPQKLLNVSPNPLDWIAQLSQLTGADARTHMPSARRLLPDFSFDPIFTFVKTANLLTNNVAAREFCISKEQLEIDMLLQHFMQNYELFVGALMTWRRVPDWLNPQSLPKWICTGIED